MKASPSFINSGHEKMPAASKQNSRSRLKRISPFLLLTIFFVFWFLYSLITNVIIITAAKIIVFSFLGANVLLADFALWNYFAGKKKGFIWIIESILSAGILYWFI
jgi:hypothetical protein